MKKGIIVLIPILQMMETDEYHLYESVEVANNKLKHNNKISEVFEISF